MNTHFKPTAEPAPRKIDLLEVEDSINTAQVASVMTHCFMEAAISNLCDGKYKDDTNAIAYAINHLNDVVQAAHDHFHRYLAQEFERRRERAQALSEPDPIVCPSWRGPGLYRFHSIIYGEFFSVSWNAEHGWFNLVIPATGARFMAMCPDLWERNVSSIVKNPAVIAKVCGEAV